MQLKIQTLGDLNVLAESEPEPRTLPPSKKTRALLAYLLLTAKSHKRSRLCEMFWDVPDDPKGALRWSLSKLRNVINDEHHTRLLTDREQVDISTEHISIDIVEIKRSLQNERLSIDRLKEIANRLKEPLLEDIDLPNQTTFQNWLTSQRNQLEAMRTNVLARIQMLTQSSTKDANASVVSLTSERQLDRHLLSRQKIQFCMTSDKVRLAYATVGEGPPLVKAANWLNHLELDWDAPIWSPIFRELAFDYHLIRYDERGNGLSDWDVSDISANAFVKDLEAIVDHLECQKFPLLGISQGAAVSIEYAVKHPERVSHLILFGAYAYGWRINATEQTIREREAIMTLTETGWGQDNPAYRQIFSSTFMPSANAEQLNWFNEFQRQTTSPENAVRFLSAFGDIDVRDLLSQVKVPTLVIHSSGDKRIPVNSGREIAASIPGAEFLSLDSDNHLLVGNEPAAKDFVEAVRRFIREN